MELRYHQEPFSLIQKILSSYKTAINPCWTNKTTKQPVDLEGKKKTKAIRSPDTACGEPEGVDGDGGKVLLFGSEG